MPLKILINMHVLCLCGFEVYFVGCKLPFVSIKCQTCVTLYKED